MVPGSTCRQGRRLLLSVSGDEGNGTTDRWEDLKLFYCRESGALDEFLVSHKWSDITNCDSQNSCFSRGIQLRKVEQKQSELGICPLWFVDFKG